MYLAVTSQLRRELPVTGREADLCIRRRRALKRVDKEISRGNFKNALSLVKQLQGKPGGGLRGFGAAKQVSRRLSSLNELNLDAKELLSLQPLFDSVMESIEECDQFNSLDKVPSDRVERLMHDEEYGSLGEEDLFMCAQHEAGHFLVGYLLGVLPKGYKVPSVETVKHDQFAGVEFMGFEFLKEVAFTRMPIKKNISQVVDWTETGEISSKTLNNFSCVILGGLVAEHIVFGYSEGHYSDIDTLAKVFSWQGYGKNEAETKVRWAALNTLRILHRHIEARSRLAEAMALGKSVGSCIDTIENALLGKEI